MDYPSTTQALFALIVMIIVLAFILVYCCWGTFSCPRPDANPCRADSDSLRGGRDRSTSSTPSTFFILPYRNMIYVGDGRTQRVFQIPIHEDKPPSYTELFNNAPLPDYRSFSLHSSGAPPTYEQCFRYGNSTVMLDDSTTSSQINIENSPANSQCILAASDLRRSSNSLRESSVSCEVPARCSNSKPYTPAAIKNWRKMSSLFGENSQSTYLPPSLFRSPTNSCCSNPCISTTSPLTERPSSVESLQNSSLPSSNVESAQRENSENTDGDSNLSVASKMTISAVDIPSVSSH